MARARGGRGAPPAALTPVAATAALGTATAVQGGQSLAKALLALSVLLWAVLLLVVARRWKRRMAGTVFLGCVATEGIALLGAVLAVSAGAAWLDTRHSCSSGSGWCSTWSDCGASTCAR